MGNLHYIVAVGATEQELVRANIHEGNIYCENAKQKALIFTQNDNQFYCKNESCKYTSYQLVGNVQKAVLMSINRRNLDYKTSLRGLLERINNCCLIIDLTGDTDEIISLIEEYREKKAIDVVLNIKDFTLFTEKLRGLYTSIKIHGSKQVIPSEYGYHILVSDFGELDGLGIFITSLLVEEFHDYYREYCEKESKPIDEDFLIVPFYYVKSSITLIPAVFNLLIERVLAKVGDFLPQTKQDIEEIFKING